MVGLVTASSRSKAAETIGTDEIRSGMKGYGLTVFEGTEPERFDVEVISVVPNFLLRQNIILIRCSHPVTDRAGVIGGMSGSPIYIEGRLAGALAYGWRFNKEPVAGVTPISDMFDVLKRKEKGLGLGNLARTTGPTGMSGHPRIISRRPPPKYFELFDTDNPDGIIPARTPLTISGFIGSAKQIITDTLLSFGIDPITGGGGGGGGSGLDKLVPGGAMGVQLIRGDMSATGIGTVTAVKGNRVLGFGHPMLNMGEGYLPVTTARIHTVIASIARSNKLGSPLNVVGSLVQDRQACVVARTDREAKMIPVSIVLEDERGRRKDAYKVEVALHRHLTATFLQAALVNVILHSASDYADVTAELKADLKVSGRPPITLTDSGAARRGLAELAGYFRPVKAVSDVLQNPFEDAYVESLDIRIRLKYGLDFAFIKGAFVTAEQPKPGEVVNVNVRMMRYGVGEEILTVPVKIPRGAAGKKIQIEVGGGDFVVPVMPIPQDLDDVLSNYSRFYPPHSVVVAVSVPGEGIAVGGEVLDQLPAFAVDALLPASGYEQISKHRLELKEVVKTDYLVGGKQTISLTVGGLSNK